MTAHENESDWRADDIPERDITAASALWRRLQDLARHGGTVAEAQALVDAAAEAPWFEATFGDGWRRVDADAWRRRQANARLDPARTAGTLGIPVLWFLAEKDQNVPYADSLRALEQASQQDDADITVVTIRDAPHSFLIEQPDGSVRYTDHYWPEMADWLEAKGFATGAYPPCGPGDVDLP
ncbi:alpha/beta hydrolase family protein [Luteimonas pelagia]